MGIDISVLMGANIASEVAAEKFCETTIGEAAKGPGRAGCLGSAIPVPTWLFPDLAGGYTWPSYKLRPVILHGALGRWFNSVCMRTRAQIPRFHEKAATSSVAW